MFESDDHSTVGMPLTYFAVAAACAAVYALAMGNPKFALAFGCASIGLAVFKAVTEPREPK